jgi:hypothetical protein
MWKQAKTDLFYHLSRQESYSMVDNILAIVHIKKELHQKIVSSSKGSQIYTKGSIHDPLRSITMGSWYNNATQLFTARILKMKSKARAKVTIIYEFSGKIYLSYSALYMVYKRGWVSD